jgi:hypothetical protein
MQPLVWKHVLVLALITLLVQTSWGQNDKPADAQPEAAPKESRVYIPFRNLKAAFENENAAAFLPYSEYLKLLDAFLGNRLRKPAQVPVAGVITSAKYAGKVEDDVARITATLNVQVLEKGWAEIPIRFGEAAIGELSSDTKKVLLRGTGNGSYALLFPDAGEHTVTLELTARVRTSPEGRSLELDVPAVGITSFELSVPDVDQAIDLQPKLVSDAVQAEGKETRIKVSVGSTEKITARWHPKVGNKPEMNLLANVTAATLISAEDGLLHTDAWLQYEVLRGQMEQVRIALPKGQRILDVTSDAKVKEWSTADEAERQVLTVSFLSRLSGKTTVEVHLESDLPTEAFDVAGLAENAAYGVHALDVVRESGQIAVRPASDISLAVEQQQGLQRLDEGETDPRIRRPGAFYFKYYSPALRLRLQARPVEPRLLVDHAAHLVISEDRLRTQDQFQFTIDRAGVFELRFKIPEGLSIENVVCDRMKQFDLSPDKQTLTVALREKVQGALAVHITGIRTAEFAELAAEQELPLIEPLGVELETGRVLIYATEAIEVVTDASKVVSAQPDPNPQPGQFPDARLVSAWMFNRRPVAISTRLVRKPTRLTAQIGTVFDVKQGQVQSRTQLAYLVEYAGLDTFRFSVPEAVADSVQITAAGSGPSIKQKSRATEAVDGWVTWTVVMQRDVTGAQEFTITYDLTPSVDEATKAERMTAELVRVLDPYADAAAAGSKQFVKLTRITGEATVLKDRALSVTASASGGDVEPIDVRELARLSQDGFTAYRYYEQPVTIELTAQKFELQGVVDVVVSRALVEVVLDRTGQATYRARYVLKTSERQRLPLWLPKNAEILGASVDRKPVSLEKNAAALADDNYDSHFINIARTKPSDQAFPVAVMYRLKLDPPPFQTGSGPLKFRLPKLEGAAGSKAAVQQLRVAAWIPEDYALVGTPKNFTVESRPPVLRFLLGQRTAGEGTADLDEWIKSDPGGVFDFPTEGRRHVYSSLGDHASLDVGWWHLPFYTWIVSGALVIVAIVLRNTSCDNKLTLLFLVAFAAAAYALSDQDLILHGLAVAAYGLVIGAALWLVHGLTQKKAAAVATTPPPPPPPSDATPSEPAPA